MYFLILIYIGMLVISSVASNCKNVYAFAPSPAPTMPEFRSTLNILDYSNPDLGIKLQYPFGWEVGSVKNGIQLIKEKDVSYVELRVQSLKDTIDLKRYVDKDIVDRKNSREGFKLIDSISPTTIANIAAYKGTYSFLKTEGSAKGEIQKILRFWSLAGDKLYTIAYVSRLDTFDVNMPAVEAIVASIKIGSTS